MSKTLNTLKTTVLGTESMNSVVKFINHNKIIYVLKNLKQLRYPSKVISCTNCTDHEILLLSNKTYTPCMSLPAIMLDKNSQS